MGLKNTGITRRDFLKTAAAALALGIVGKPGFSAAKEDHDLVVVWRSGGGHPKGPGGHGGNLPLREKRAAGRHSNPTCPLPIPPTGPRRPIPLVVATVAQACIEAGAQRVLVLDHPLQTAELCLERTGIREACKAIKGVHVLALQDRKFFREIKVPQGKVLDRVEVLKDVLDSEVLINLPLAKSHSATGVSLGFKGLMGLIWDRESFHSQYNINQAMADLATVIKPQLTILDATRALVSGGPGGPGDVKSRISSLPASTRWPWIPTR